MSEFLKQFAGGKSFLPSEFLDGTFPSLDSLAPAIVYGIALSILRLILQALVFKVTDIHRMHSENR